MKKIVVGSGFKMRKSVNDSIEYIDHGKIEEYIIKKKGQTLVLKAHGSQYDGGWLGVGLNLKVHKQKKSKQTKMEFIQKT